MQYCEALHFDTSLYVTDYVIMLFMDDLRQLQDHIYFMQYYLISLFS